MAAKNKGPRAVHILARFVPRSELCEEGRSEGEMERSGLRGAISWFVYVQRNKQILLGWDSVDGTLSNAGTTRQQTRPLTWIL